jgi:hypothetical protein
VHEFLRTWFLSNSFIAGLFALGWLILRSGPKPSRLAYPCQQAAFSAATLALGAPIVSTVLAARRHIAAGLRSPVGLAAAIAVVLGGLAASGYITGVHARTAVLFAPPPDYRAEVFHVSSCAQDPTGDRFSGLDGLISLMANKGLKIYRSPIIDFLSGPDGVIGSNDVVIIKINSQWAQRGGTNVDLLQGLIRVLVDHPDGFTGEVVVCENAQFQGTADFDRTQNNAQDHSLSTSDVVSHYQTLGHDVSLYDWTLDRYASVDEYVDGDMTDGYVVSGYDAQLGGRVSYPKFQTDAGTYVSLRDGIWDPDSSNYNRQRLKVINLPVLKSHHSTYGVTACVKNYMGLVTKELSTNSHSAIRNGILGAVMGEIRPPDLNILDCIWINANPYSGPGTSYAGATRRDQLVASVDPVAADMWATSNILIPAFQDNGYSPPWPEPSADPTDPSSDFRYYLDRSMSHILAAGFDATNNMDAIDAYSSNLALAVFADGLESASTLGWRYVGAGGLAITADAAYTGSYGLEVTVESSCAAADPVVLTDQTVSTPWGVESCNSITAGSNFVVGEGGDVVFAAGEGIVLTNGFSVQPGGGLTAAIDASLTYSAFVQDDSPASEVSFNAQFFLNLDSVILGGADELEHLVAYDLGGTPQLRLVIQSGPELVLEVRDDAGGFNPTAAIGLSSGWNEVVLNWEATASATASLTVNDGPPVDLTGLDTDARRIDFVRWGVVGGSLFDSSGTVLQDDYSSWR